jgi:hypothetical protein
MFLRISLLVSDHSRGSPTKSFLKKRQSVAKQSNYWIVNHTYGLKNFLYQNLKHRKCVDSKYFLSHSNKTANDVMFDSNFCTPFDQKFCMVKTFELLKDE